MGDHWYSLEYGDNTGNAIQKRLDLRTAQESVRCIAAARIGDNVSRCSERRLSIDVLRLVVAVKAARALEVNNFPFIVRLLDPEVVQDKDRERRIAGDIGLGRGLV